MQTALAHAFSSISNLATSSIAKVPEKKEETAMSLDLGVQSSANLSQRDEDLTGHFWIF